MNREELREKIAKIVDDYEGDMPMNNKAYKRVHNSRLNKAVDQILALLPEQPKIMGEAEIEKVLADLMPRFVWGYVCNKCRGGGSDGGSNICSKCNGVGIIDWQTSGLAHALYGHIPAKEEDKCKTCPRPDFTKTGHDVDKFYEDKPLPPQSEEVRSDFREELKSAINRHSKENGSDTPDFILAEYLENCLKAFDEAMSKRTQYYNI